MNKRVFRRFIVEIFGGFCEYSYAARRSSDATGGQSYRLRA
jgi:hypothetical protein